ncbi:MAG: NAD(P)-dependent oxidoreductase [Pirellulales bacterium]|nr:NAD(P)-dependent oxidoreductase [Pirellulales bacterium]
MEPISPQTRIGWIGLGVMGCSMCGHLRAAGYSVTAHTRTASKAKPLIEQGAVWADDAAGVVEASDIVFTMLGYPEDVQAVYLGERGLLQAARPETVLVDMTTSQPALAMEIAGRGERSAITVIDAPVSGGDIGAQNATLSIMLGGPEEVCRQLWPLWELMGQKIVYQGTAGMGQHTKMVNQTLIASGMVGLCEALLYGYRAGLDLDTVLESVSSGAAGSWSLSNLAPRILRGDFKPGFFVHHFIKDMGIALGEARRMQISLPGLALAEQLYVALAAQGHQNSGTQALQLALAQLSGIDWNARDVQEGDKSTEE